MALRDWIIVLGLGVAMPVWLVALRHQWSDKPGATKRMLKACTLSAIIVVATMGAAYLTAEVSL